jgi:hypothetical protein
MFKVYQRTRLAEFLGDRVVYRNLVPADPQLPGLAKLAGSAGLAPGCIPRKSEQGYAVVVAHILKQAQVQRGVTQPVRRLLYLGDTRLLDGTAFGNLCAAGGWPGLAFIGSENSQDEKYEIVPHVAGSALYLANRWSALFTFSEYVKRNGFPVDETTTVVIDLDKTALGARGRNGEVIDAARLQAVYDTVAGLLGDRFNPAAFKTAYDLLNQPEFHPFTGDNQDYLAYICLVLESGLYQLETVAAAVRHGELVSFAQFIRQVEAQRSALGLELRDIHDEIYAYVRAGDPTPFKLFRRKEYRRTIERFGNLPDNAPLDSLLREEILITEEVRRVALRWLDQGALLFGLSDKPDEAATPTPELAALGYQPIHRALTHAVGV